MNDDSKYKYCDINNKIIRISIDNYLDIWSWREYKTKDDVWFKIKPYLYTNPRNGYQSYKININYKLYTLSRVIYKLYNKNWDITDVSKNNIIDHINRNSLDNQIENLRNFTQQHNCFNRNARGTYFRKDANCWRAQLVINGKKKSKSGFETEELAHQHYLILKQKYHIIPNN